MGANVIELNSGILDDLHSFVIGHRWFIVFDKLLDTV